MQGLHPDTGTLSVKNNSNELGDIYVNVAWGSDSNAGKVVYTNDSGKTYYYNGVVDNAYRVGPLTPNGTTELASSTIGFTITLSANADGTGTPTSDDFIAAAGTYTLTFTATREVKIGSDAATAIAVTSEGSTFEHTLTFNSSGTITAGETGTIHYGFMGIDDTQTGAGGTIEFTSVA